MKRVMGLIVGVVLLGGVCAEGYGQGGDLILNPGGTGGYFSMVFLGGGLYRSHTGQFSLTEEETVCCNFNGGEGIGPSLALRTEYTPDPEGRLRFALRIGVEHESATFMGETEVLPVLGEGNRPQDGLFQNELRVATTSLELAPIAMVKLAEPGIYFSLGMNYSRTLATSTDLTERIVAPAGLTFLDGSTEKERPNIPAALVADDRYSLTAGLDLRYPLTKTLGLAAELHYEHPITSYGQETEWKAKGVVGAVGVELRIKN